MGDKTPNTTDISPDLTEPRPDLVKTRPKLGQREIKLGRVQPEIGLTLPKLVKTSGEGAPDLALASQAGVDEGPTQPKLVDASRGTSTPLAASLVGFRRPLVEIRRRVQVGGFALATLSSASISVEALPKALSAGRLRCRREARA